MRNTWILLLGLVIILSSCQKEDDRIVLPPPGPVQQLVATLGNNYDEQVYVSLSKGLVHSAPYRNFDLAFEAAETGFHIYLNGAKYMFACRTGSTDFLTADSTGQEWRIDAEQLYADSTAIGNWWVQSVSNTGGLSEVFVVDRGRLDHSGMDRYRKIQVIVADDVHYQIKFSNMDNSGITVMDIPKDHNYSLMYLSFNNGGSLIQQAPPKDDWDFVFTKYTHVYFDEPMSSPFRYYPVTGAITNIWNATSGTVLKLDSTAYYCNFDQFVYTNVAGLPFSTNADIIGFNWKYYDFASSQYHITPDNFYILSDKNGMYFKLRMIDFYDQNGNKGTVTMEYQRI